MDSSGSGKGPGTASYEHYNESLDSVKCSEFLDQFSYTKRKNN
jgi:hypothetical protein